MSGTAHLRGRPTGVCPTDAEEPEQDADDHGHGRQELRPAPATRLASGGLAARDRRDRREGLRYPIRPAQEAVVSGFRRPDGCQAQARARSGHGGSPRNGSCQAPALRRRRATRRLRVAAPPARAADGRRAHWSALGSRRTVTRTHPHTDRSRGRGRRGSRDRGRDRARQRRRSHLGMGRGPRGVRGGSGRRRGRGDGPCGQKLQRVDVAVGLRGPADTEMQVGRLVLELARGAHRSDRLALDHGRTSSDRDRAEVEQGHRVAVGRLDRDRAAVQRQRAGEARGSGSGCAHGLAQRTADVGPAVLTRLVLVGRDRERAEDRAGGRPRPGRRCRAADSCTGEEHEACR
jgi:hypothetical protein